MLDKIRKTKNMEKEFTTGQTGTFVKDSGMRGGLLGTDR